MAPAIRDGSVVIPEAPPGLPRTRHRATPFVYRLCLYYGERPGGVGAGSYGSISRCIQAMGCPCWSESSVKRAVQEIKGLGTNEVEVHPSLYGRNGKQRRGINRYVVRSAGGRAQSDPTGSTKGGGGTTSTSSTTSSPTTSGTAQRAATQERASILARRLASRPPLEGLPTTQQVLDEALRRAAAGERVLPVWTGGQGVARKIPLSPHGFKSGTTDEKKIRRWWRDYPGASLGMVIPEGVFVVDVDPRHGGDQSLAYLEAQHGSLPATVEQYSGGGGRHLFFSNPGLGKLRQHLGGLEGLDVLPPGMMVVVAPSTHPSGGRYAWKPGCAPGEVAYARAPEWLERLAVKPTPPKVARIYAPFTATRAAVLGPIHEGERNDTLHKIGSGLRGYRGLEEYEIADRLQWHNQTRCDSPLPLCEVQEIARSCARYQRGPRN